MIRIGFAGNANEDLGTALATPVQGVPVGQLVQVEEKPAPIEVVRVNQRPVSVIEALVEEGIRPIVARQERVAENMADGFSRVSNGRKIGVVTVQGSASTVKTTGGYATDRPGRVRPNSSALSWRPRL